MTGPKWEAPQHCDVQQWGEAEEKEDGGDRTVGKHREGLDIYRKSIKGDPSFKCLGRNMTAGDDYWPAVARNLVKEKKS